MSGTYYQPKITIITVVYNGEHYIEKTIQSVIQQTYNNKEYIIIDGKSNDNTVDVIRKYNEHINIMISEPDTGIYDAMNKGIDLASGEWIIFMNSGDQFYSSNVIESIFLNLDNFKVQMIYGHCNIIYNSGYERIKKAKAANMLWKGMSFSHQSLFVQTSLLKKHKFNSKNRIGADFEFVYEAYINKVQFMMVDMVVASISAGGLSDQDRLTSIISHWNAVKKHQKINGYINLYYIMLLIDAYLRQMLKKILPEKINNFIIQCKKSS